MLLTVIIVVGLGVAALEKWRNEEAYEVWGSATEVLSFYLEPLRNQTQKIVQVVRWVRDLWDVEKDNRRLSRDLSLLRVEHQLTLEQLGRLERLSGLGHWSGPEDLRFITADVTGLLTSEQGAVIVINRGRDDGLQPRDPVVALGGLVGVVREVSPHSARVQALSDYLSGVGAMVRSTRARGVVQGQGRGNPLAFKPENEVLPIEAGDTLVTSGFDNSVYPKGITIGTIKKRDFSAEGLIYGQVDPAVPFETIEEVLVIIPARRRGRDDSASTETLGRFTIQMPSAAWASDATTTPTLTGDRPATFTLMTTATLPAVTAAPTTLTLLLERLRRSQAERLTTRGAPQPVPTVTPEDSTSDTAGPETPMVRPTPAKTPARQAGSRRERSGQ